MHPLAIDRDALHRFLYRRADHFHRLRFDLRELADEVGVNYAWLSQVITEMAHEGRMRRIAGAKQQQKTYRVEDPATWRRQSRTA
jgi:hypothetical protein